MSTITHPAIDRENWRDFNASRVRDWSLEHPEWQARVGHVDDIALDRTSDGDREWLERLVGHYNCFDEFAREYNQSLALAEAAAPDPEVLPISPDPDLVARIRELESEVATLRHRTFSRYDESMRPMFAHAARVAQFAGFCSEYDRIAEAVGGPSRDDLSGEAELVYEFTVPVTLTRTVHVTVSATGTDESDAWDRIEGEDIDSALYDYEYDDNDWSSYVDAQVQDPEE
jgi:hypothetical protein